MYLWLSIAESNRPLSNEAFSTTHQIIHQFICSPDFGKNVLKTIFFIKNQDFLTEKTPLTKIEKGVLQLNPNVSFRPLS
jgi:hypothetical protein